MNAQRDPDVVLAAWLDDGPAELPSSTRRAISTAVRTTPQARTGLHGLPARRPTMSRFLALAGAAAVVAVGIGLFAVAGPRSPDGVGGIPSASPSPSPTPTPTPASPSPSLDPTLDTTLWQPFASSRYGYTAAHPAGWTETPASRAWSWSRDITNWQTPAADTVIDKRPEASGHQVLVTAFAVDVARGTTLAGWSNQYLGPTGVNGTSSPPCWAIISDASVVVDGHPGRVVTTSCGDSDAFVLLGTRMYVFSDWLEGQRPLLDAFLTTVRFGSG